MDGTIQEFIDHHTIPYLIPMSPVGYPSWEVIPAEIAEEHVGVIVSVGRCKTAKHVIIRRLRIDGLVHGRGATVIKRVVRNNSTYDGLV